MEQHYAEQSIILPRQNTKHESTTIKEKPKLSYFTRLFFGRLNRQNYLFGSTFFVLVPMICFLVVIFNILLSPDTLTMPYLDQAIPTQVVTPNVPILSLLEKPTNEIWIIFGVLFIILSLPYLFSLQIKRLHDLNLNGWLWMLNLMPLASFFVAPFSQINSTNEILIITANFLSIVGSFFSIYVSFWPGTIGPNKYGDSPIPRTSFFSDIMQLK
ncbi:MAG TPA: DUF805 domain-containing protein [Candidatus Sulfotelmatobacter sp.]|jgi:uncharacterized membrane protein YhaH (DUF805 family)|nr:DUF805 domain-containing protein [Candidatus Sulfotelmatobacter sp.]